MTSISIFTPSHHNRFIAAALASLQAQTDPDWEWVVGHNNGGVRFRCDDPRVRQIMLRDVPPHVGALKAAVCDAAKGEVLLELDHDDMLAPTAIAEVRAAFETPEVGFVYSNAVRATADLRKAERFGNGYGWQYRETEFQGHLLDEPISFEPTPASLSRVWYAPDHLRSFRREVYNRVGGYNPALRVLDDQDLMCRMYQETEFRHIDRGLYLYRIHGSNTWLLHNQEIQDNTWKMHDSYAMPLAMTWARRSGLRCLDLGARFAACAGFETVDRKDADVVCDLDGRWPFEDSSVGVLRAADVFEHLRDPLHTMKEAYRVLAPGGWLFAQVPSTDGRGAWQDPTHVSFWNENSWLYYSHARWAKYIDTPVRFQKIRAYTTIKDDIGVCWTCAHLVSMKGGYQPPGAIEI